MSMLAEPRRKLRYTINPNGNTWANDTNAFGKKMLEKMGWSSGKGLGANLDGMTTHIKVQHKSDQQGVGFKDRNDQWTEHEDNFSQLLKSLQSDGHQVVETNEEGNKSLELKSKSSKARVHYKKFTRGKDLSRYSSKDLANIFGRTTLEKTPKNDVTEIQKPEIVKETEESEETSKTFGVDTLQGGSMTDYFKKKMSQFKINFSTKVKPSENEENSENEGERASFGLGFSGLGFKASQDEVDQPRNNFGLGFVQSTEQTLEDDKNDVKIDKKSKKRKRTLENDVNDAEEIETFKKKKKKLKKEEIGLENQGFNDLGDENCDSGVSLDDNPFEVKVKSKKSKNKDKHKIEDKPAKDEKEQQTIDENHQENNEKPKKMSKKDKKLKIKEDNVIPVEDVIEEVKSCKKKKKKHNDTELGLENPNFKDNSLSEEAEIENQPNPYEITPKKKKSKKNKSKEESSAFDNPNFEENSSENLEISNTGPETEDKLPKIENLQENNLETPKIKKNKKNKHKEDSSTLENSKLEENNLESQDNSINITEIDANITKTENPYEITPKKKKSKKKKHQDESTGLENPNFEDISFQIEENHDNFKEINTETPINPYEVVPKDKKNKKKRKHQDIGLENPNFNPEDTLEVVCDNIEETTPKNKKKKTVITENNLQETTTVKEISSDEFLQSLGIGEDFSDVEEEEATTPNVDSNNIENHDSSIKGTEIDANTTKPVNPFNITPIKKKNRKKKQPEDSDVLFLIEKNQYNLKEKVVPEDKKKNIEQTTPKNEKKTVITDNNLQETTPKKEITSEEFLRSLGIGDDFYNAEEEKESLKNKVNDDQTSNEASMSTVEDTVKGNADNLDITIDNLMLNVTSTEPKPILSTPQSIAQNKLKRRKSVRIDESLNQERIIPNVLQQKQMAQQDGKVFDTESVGITNPSFNICANDQGFYDSNLEVSTPTKGNLKQGISNPGYRNVQEEIEDAQKSLDSYQAEVENDINEGKALEDDDLSGSRFIGTISELDEHVRLANGNIKLAFKNAKLNPCVNYYHHSSENVIKKSYCHLVKGDIELAFKGSNLHKIVGYASVSVLQRQREQAAKMAALMPVEQTAFMSKVETLTRIMANKRRFKAESRGLNV